MRAIGSPEYINKKCWLVRNSDYQVMKRCRYCQKKWRNCLTFQYLMSIPLITLAFFVVAFILNVDMPQPRLAYLIGSTTLVVWIALGFLYNRAVDNLVESSYRLSLTHQELAERTIEQAALYDIVRLINSTLDLKNILDFAAKGAATAAGAETSYITMLKGTEVTDQASCGSNLMERAPELGSLMKEAMKTVVTTGQPIIMEDSRTDPRFASIPQTAELIRSFIMTPIRRQGVSVGALTVTNKEDGKFGKNDLRLVQSIADQLGVAILNSDLYMDAVDEKEQATAIIENAAEGVCVLDSNKDIVRVNKAWEEITGWKAEETVGRTCGDLQRARTLDGRDICNTACCFERMQDLGKMSSGSEVFITTKNGHLKKVFENHVFVTRSNGERWCIIILNQILPHQFEKAEDTAKVANN